MIKWKSKGGKEGSYEPTASDRLWLMRAVQAEGQPHGLVARALVNLFAATYPTHTTLESLVRDYAQPVNPKWADQGDERTQAKRAAAAARTVFDAPVRLAVNDALSSSFSGDITDYAAPTLDATHKGYERRTDSIPGFNAFWTRKPGWPGYSAAGASAVVAVALCIAALLYVASRGA